MFKRSRLRELPFEFQEIDCNRPALTIVQEEEIQKELSFEFQEVDCNRVEQTCISGSLRGRDS